MKISKKTAALLCAACLLTATGCGAEKQPQTSDTSASTTETTQTTQTTQTTSGTSAPTAAQTQDTQTAQPTQTQTAQTQTQTDTSATAPTQTVTSAVPTKGTTAPKKTAKPTQTTKKAAPQSKAEIVALYASAHTKAKSTAKTAHKTLGGAELYRDIFEVGNSAFLQSLGKTLVGTFAKIENEDKTYSGRQEILNNAPARTVAACSLKASDIKRATCTDRGGYYEVKLDFNCDEAHPAVNPKLGSGMVGTVFNIITLEEMESYIKTVPHEGGRLCYVNCRLTAKIDKASGALLQVEQEFPCILSYKKAAGISNVRIGLKFIENWSFEY